MATDPMNVPDVELGDEPYDSEEDEDFQVEAAQDDSDMSSDDEGEEGAAEGPAAKKRKTAKEPKGEDKELDSGDEVTIKKAKAKKDKKGKGKAKGKDKGKDSDDEDDVDFDDEEGGPGGFVRTRAMKSRMQEERKPLAKIDGATIDVDALWEKMNAPATDSGTAPSQPEDTSKSKPDTEKEKKEKETPQPPKPTEMIKIKRTYKFAGEMITEEKVVPKDSAEAKLFLANGDAGEGVDAENTKTLKLRRPLRKISRFDPNPTGSIKKSWEKQQQPTEAAAEARGPKINTVEKSRMDWAAYVDQAGIKDELNVHSKAKEGYLGRMDFLDRVGAKRDEEARNARLKGM